MMSVQEKYHVGIGGGGGGGRGGSAYYNYTGLPLEIGMSVPRLHQPLSAVIDSIILQLTNLFLRFFEKSSTDIL